LSEHDFDGLDHIFVDRHLMQLAVVRGYLNDRIEWLPPAFVNALGYDSCTAYYDEVPARWALADREGRWRRECEGILASVISPGDETVMMDGKYFMMPPDDESELLKLRNRHTRGARWAVLARDCFWALDSYPRLLAELRNRHVCAVQTDLLMIFRLRDQHEE
jgi:hypothetical protein